MVFRNFADHLAHLGITKAVAIRIQVDRGGIHRIATVDQIITVVVFSVAHLDGVRMNVVVVIITVRTVPGVACWNHTAQPRGTRISKAVGITIGKPG